MALAASASDLASGDAAVVIGAALARCILGFVLLSPPARVLADRADRKRLSVTADGARAALVGLFPFVTTAWQVAPRPRPAARHEGARGP